MLASMQCESTVYCKMLWPPRPRAPPDSIVCPYAWGQEELARITAEMEATADRILPGAGVRAAIDHLDRDPAYQLHGTEELRVWMQGRADEVIADLGALQTWGLTTDKRHVVVDSSMRTNLDRVFAAGDITEYPGKVRLIAVGFGEAATAVNNAAVAIDPSAHVFPGHSSEG